MVNCPKCGKINSDDAAFCTSCGASLQSDVGSTIERHAKQFAQNMEQAGKKVGDQMTQAAKKVHETTQKEARHFEQRMDRCQSPCRELVRPPLWCIWTIARKLHFFNCVSSHYHGHGATE